MRFAPFRAGFLALALTACASAVKKPAPPSPAAPGAGGAPGESPGESALPPVPLVTGALAINVVYPTANQLLQSRDSNFIFGSVGNGKASLSIDGQPVRVYPNGSFIAWLPIPPRDSARYDLVAVLGADTARSTRAVRLLPPVPALAPYGPLVVDSSSVTPGIGLALRDDEEVRVGVRAPENVDVSWRADTGAPVPLVSEGAMPRRTVTGDSATASVPARYAGDPDAWATRIPAARLRAPSWLVVSRGGDTVRLPVPPVAPAPPRDTWGMLGADSAAQSDTDRVIIGRPVPGGTYKWLLMPGTVVQVTGRAPGFARVRLDRQLEIWVKDTDVSLLPAGYAPAARVAGNARLVRDSGWVDLVIPMATRPPFLVEEDDHRIDLTLYGVTGNTDIIDYGAADSLVRVVRWEPVASDRVRYTLRLGTQPYGYLALWDGSDFVLRVRRPPRVDPAHPLAGITVAVDPGHPPIGATGPTGLWEPVATLAVGEAVRAMLAAKGAHVVMTRVTPAPVALGDRPIIARRANADVLVSIHLNALPDGVNPFTANGTGDYFFHAQSAPLARDLQRGLVRAMGLRDNGIHYDNLALARPTWMPAVLCEGAFIMMPAQEAALRTPQFQAAYARGIVDGLERYFRSLADAR